MSCRLVLDSDIQRLAHKNTVSYWAFRCSKSLNFFTEPAVVNVYGNARKNPQSVHRVRIRKR